MKVRKAVITAAGLGTRFLPFTRSQPKEMLPLGWFKANLALALKRKDIGPELREYLKGLL